MTKSPEFQISDIPNLNGHVAIVTGGNSGIGYETTFQLALRGARVYIASRSRDRVSEAILSMQKTGGGGKGECSLDIHFLKLDLEDMESVKTAAYEFMQMESRLDILINNAGIMASPYRLTKDGFEAQWQVCFLAHHALTLSLLPLLRSTAAQHHPSNGDRVRIVNVSSDAAFVFGPKEINEDDPNMAHLTGRTAPWRRYGHAKLASILSAAALNSRYHHSDGISAYSLHPGIIKSNLQSHDTTVFGTVTRIATKILPTSSPLDGARTSLYCATSSGAPRQVAGRFVVPFGKRDCRADKLLEDHPEAVNKLWEVAERQLRSKGFVLDL